MDGQQRITTLYGVIRGRAPKFFDGHVSTFTGLRFHLENERFEFWQPVKMRDDSLWIDVTELMQKGTSGLGTFVAELSQQPEFATKVGDYVGRLSQILSIADIDLHIEEVTGKDKSIDVVVDVFNRVNSGGTKLSKGDLALAKICAEWPEGRETMKSALKKWQGAEFHFTLDWLLRNVNTLVTGEAKFQYLHEVEAERVQEGLKRTLKYVDYLLNIIGGRLGLDHDRVFFGRFGLPVMVRYLDNHGGKIGDQKERDHLLFWYLQAAMWGRFSGSVESYIDQDLGVIETPEGALDRLIEQLRLWHGGLRVEPNHFSGWSLGARFYPVLYMLTRIGEARDWGTGLALKRDLLGKMSRLEVHHIFPKAQLYKRGYKRADVNALANFCFLTKDTNLQISDRLPRDYFREIENNHPGALASQWIPADDALWEVDRYPDFLSARKTLLAEAANEFFAELLHDDATRLLGEAAPTAPPVEKVAVVGGIDSEEEEAALEALSDWVAKQELPPGELAFELSDSNTGEPLAILDLAWPAGLQEELSQPVAVLINEGPETLAVASAQGFRCFTSAESFKKYVQMEVLTEALPEE